MTRTHPPSLPLRFPTDERSPPDLASLTGQLGSFFWPIRPQGGPQGPASNFLPQLAKDVYTATQLPRKLQRPWFSVGWVIAAYPGVLSWNSQRKVAGNSPRFYLQRIWWRQFIHIPQVSQTSPCPGEDEKGWEGTWGWKWALELRRAFGARPGSWFLLKQPS